MTETKRDDFVDVLDAIAQCASNALRNPNLDQPEVRHVLVEVIGSLAGALRRELNGGDTND